MVCCVPGGIVRAAAAGQALDARVKVGLEKEGDGVAVAQSVRHHPMQRRFK